MSLVRRRSKFLVLLVAVAGLALALSACAFFKEGSLSVSQPQGIGNARVHFVLCTEPEGSTCEPNEEHETPEPNEQLQYLIGIAVPSGAAAPASFTAQPITPDSPLITFTRNDQVATELAAASNRLAEEEFPPEAEFEAKPWPPAGLEGIGYLSTPVEEEEGSLDEWAVDADFGLPVPSDGSPFSGPFAAATAEGAREVSSSHPASAPVHCYRFEGKFEKGEAFCSPTAEEAQAGTSDLKIAAAATASVFVGGKATLQFPMNFASTAGLLPVFNVTAGTSLSGATAAVSASSFTPPAVDAGTHRSSGSETVTVVVPKTAAPGVYDVTITATTPQGGTATQVAKLEVKKAKLKVGKAKLNKRNGTAKLSVGVPGAGTLTASGKTIVKAKRKATGPTTLKLTIKSKGKAKKKLNSTGKAKVKVKLVFKPENGAPVTKTKSIVLKKKLS
ncbi:MAG: hypothetical protein ACTHNY_02380 [Solirubrobacterales bacterium]